MDRKVRFWDRIAKGYDKQNITLDATESKTVEMTKKYLAPSDVVLDYGCGPGALTSALAADVKEIHGLDISPKMIEIASRMAAESRITNLQYAEGTIFDERYEKDSFNAILAFNILHLLDDVHEAIQRIYQLLVPGGVFISVTPCMGARSSLLSILFSFLSKVGIIPPTNIPTLSELEQWVNSGIFQVEDTQKLQQNPLNYFIVAKKR